jgi:two-component system cell cycle sensor histidine kinase/response regulator CckA
MLSVIEPPSRKIVPPAKGPAVPGSMGSFQLALLDRAHQQAAVAALGQAALTGVDLPTLIEQAAIFVAQTLSVEFSSIYELQEDLVTLRMLAGHGWSSGMVGITVWAEQDSMAAYVLQSAEPVVVRDARAITAFQVPEFLRAHGVVSSISVVIPGGTRPWGILEAQCQRGRTFVEDDYHFLQAVANVISTAHTRKQNETEREHLAAFVEHNPNPVMEVDAMGTVVYCNDAARIVTGGLHKTLPGQLLPPNTAELVRHCLQKDVNILDQPVLVSGRTLSWSFFPLAGVGRVHAYGEDVTERLSLEEQLRQSQKMEALGQLAAGVAHDFNNILTIMQGLVRRLGASASQDQGDTLNQLFETTERAASLTKQLLTFSRRQVLQTRVISLGETVANMSRMLERLIGSNIILVASHTPDAPAIKADASMIEQIMLNLAVNARDAMPQGGQLSVCTDVVESEDENGVAQWVRLRVSDTGTGISPEVISRIFEPFFTTKELGKGTGLGLATVFGIVKQHEGYIDVESEMGQGTTFTLLFPASGQILPREVAPAAPTAPVHGNGETILLVEDEPLLRELAYSILIDSGYRVLTAEHIEDAFAVWYDHAHEIDLLLTDMMLPGDITGRELALQLQASKPSLKVIYSTGYSQDLLDEDDDPEHFLQKPYPPDKLMRIVRSCLDAAPREALAA